MIIADIGHGLHPRHISEQPCAQEFQHFSRPIFPYCVRFVSSLLLSDIVDVGFPWFISRRLLSSSLPTSSSSRRRREIQRTRMRRFALAAAAAVAKETSFTSLVRPRLNLCTSVAVLTAFHNNCKVTEIIGKRQKEKIAMNELMPLYVFYGERIVNIKAVK